MDEFTEAAQRLTAAENAARAAGLDRTADGRWVTRSKAAMIGFGKGPGDHLEPGAFIRGVTLAGSRDAQEQAEGKAILDGFRSAWQEPLGKATAGTTAGTGGWLIPGNIVDRMTKPARYQSPYMTLCSVVEGVTAEAVDVPFRTSAPDRAVVAGWNTLKQNQDLLYDGYSATLWTLARIHDVSKQLLRKSAGAAEADVVDELAHAFQLGISYYVLRGAGTTEPYGVQTAIANAPATFTSTFSPAATLAGSVATAVMTAAKDLALRNRTGNLTAVTSPTGFLSLMSQGSDNAGYFIAGVNGNAPIPGFGVVPVVAGIPVIADNQIAGADDLLVGDFKELRLYIGEGYRLETSDTANTRWDYNLVGYRAEMELGLDARPAVYAGAFQFVSDIAP